MPVNIPGSWISFCIAVALMLLFSFIMHLLSKFFITRDVLHKRFSIMDLQLASSELEINNLMRGIYKLEPVKTKKVLSNLKAHLAVDYLFMPAAYGAIFIACMLIAAKMPTDIGRIFFSILGWLQVAAWISDIIENGYLLNMVNNYKPGEERSDTKFFGVFQMLVAIKWLVALVALVCVLSALLYFWLSGFYRSESLWAIAFFIVEIAAFLLLCRLFNKTGKDFVNT